MRNAVRPEQNLDRVFDMSDRLHLKVTNLAQVHETFRVFNPHIVVSILDAGLDAPTLKSADLNAHLILRLFDTHDIDARQMRAALLSVQALCDGLDHKVNNVGRVIVHCNAGASRSTAVALFLLASDSKHTPCSAFADLLRMTNKPWPNDRIVSLADDMLDLRGRLIEELRDYKRSYPRRLDAYRRLNRRRGIILTPYVETSPLIAVRG